MAQGSSVDDVAHVYRGLLDALAELDKAGEFIAAAHVAAAIDSLEPRFAHAHPSPDSPHPQDAITMFADRMLEAFGASADIVARRQLLDANDSTLLVWAAILNRIGARMYSATPSK